MRMLRNLCGVLLLSSGLSIAPSSVAWAGTLDGVVFSMQDQGFDGRKGVRQDRRASRDVQPSQFVPPDKGRARGQMTDEERRQLHRDLDKANREIYGAHRGR